uniref:Uncharacterized 34.3 kDa protein in ATP6 5'region n=1 Tax=Podospora anserina (strain S / ATCC MYA-4624 / DSM 980 / FGSC 10383) TaxID=515849 RepID=YMA6_PODAN|nr:orf296 [Podospora anserina]P15562.1 RecName: Full=Uncharacterized 34.3 kDa protein in ATP6 5'region; AltName: Full=ORFC [Podospora anserina S mat+]CAA33626.1 ND6 (AA 1 - 296) [Podospora anserina]CAA38814.1 unnamed protein product [Podospora anserina]
MNSNYPLFWIKEILTNGFVENILYIFIIMAFLTGIYSIIANLIKFVINYINIKITKIITLIENWLKKSDSSFVYFILLLYLLLNIHISLNFVLYFRIVILGFISIKNMEISTLISFIDYISEIIANIIDRNTLKMGGTDSDSNPLSHVYEFASKSSKPKEVEKAIPNLPENVPKYPGKIVKPVPNNLLEKRGLSSMSVEMPSNTTNPSDIERLNNLLEDIKKSLELYDNQSLKFRKHISEVNNNDPNCVYDPRSKELFKDYIKLVDLLKDQQKDMGNKIINELKNIDPNIKHKYFK